MCTGQPQPQAQAPDIQQCPVPVEPEPKKLTLEVVGTRGLWNEDGTPLSGESDCYCAVRCQGKTLHKTKLIQDCSNLRWRETVEVTEWEEVQSSEFHFFERGECSSEFLANIILESQSFATEGFNNEVKVTKAGKDINAFVWLKIKVPGKDFPTQPLAEFEIELDKGDATTWGLDLDTQDPRLICVQRVKAGPFERYNQDAHPERQLTANLFIKSVNGVEGSSRAMMNEFKENQKVKLVVMRSYEMPVCLSMPDRPIPMGLLVYQKSGQGQTLVILNVMDGGLVEDNNSRVADEELKIKEGDRIIGMKASKDGFVPAHVRITLLRPRVQM